MSREEEKAETWRILNEPISPKFRIEKTVVKAKSRTLKATWTVETPQDLQSEYGEDIHRILSDELFRVKK